MNLKEVLKDKLTKEELKHVKRSFEIIGDIAIIEIPEELEDKKHVIAEALTEINKHIKVVIRKTGELSGEYRTGKYELLTGNRTETIYTESGCRFKLDPTKVYFSEKLGTERQKIAEQVKDNESILCMFAGIGPFPIIIARKKDVKIHAVEINPTAVKYFKENVKLNKVADKIEIFKGDVDFVVPKINKKFDRILMPAPKNAEDFLDLALDCVKKNGTINYYTFAGEENFKTLRKDIREKCKKKVKITDIRKCGSFAPGVFRVAVDFRVLD